MHISETYVRARIDSATKERAIDALDAMDLSISEAIRLFMQRIADERRLPFEIKAPNSHTKKATVELESGRGKKHKDIRALIEDLNGDD